jgi:hypothetical protein
MRRHRSARPKGWISLLWLALLGFLIVGGRQAVCAEEFRIPVVDGTKVPSVFAKRVLIPEESLKEDSFRYDSDGGPIIRSKRIIERAWSEWVWHTACTACRAAPDSKLSMSDFWTVLQGKGGDSCNKLAINQQIIDDSWPSPKIDPRIVNMRRWIGIAIFDQIDTAHQQSGAFGVYQNSNILGGCFGSLLGGSSASACGGGSVFRSSGRLVNGAVRFIQNTSLTKNANRSEDDKDKRSDLNKFVPYILAALLFAIGVGIVAYSVFQSRNSLCYAVFLLLCAWAYFFWLVLSFLPEHFAPLARLNAERPVFPIVETIGGPSDIRPVLPAKSCYPPSLVNVAVDEFAVNERVICVAESVFDGEIWPVTVPWRECLFGMSQDQTPVNFVIRNFSWRSTQPDRHIESGRLSEVFNPEFVNIIKLAVWSIEPVFSLVDIKGIFQEDIGPQIALRGIKREINGSFELDTLPGPNSDQNERENSNRSGPADNPRSLADFSSRSLASCAASASVFGAGIIFTKAGDCSVPRWSAGAGCCVVWGCCFGG